MTYPWIQTLVAWLSENPGWLNVAMFVTALAESLAIAGILVPGVALLFAIALLAAQADASLPQLLLWAGAGAVVGDALSYWLGRQLQGRLHRIWPLSRHPEMLARAEALFLRHGGKSVVMGRFVGPIRPVIPLVAGAFNMAPRRFLLFNVASAIAWAPVYVLPGFVVGSALIAAPDLPPRLYPLVVTSVAVLIITHLLFFRIQLGLHGEGWLYRHFQRLVAAYPASHRLWYWLARKRPAQASEFPLASICLAMGALALFVLWSVLSQATQVLQPADMAARDLFAALRHPLFDAPLVLLTLPGDPPVLLGGALLAAATLAVRGYQGAACHIVAAAALTLVSVWLLKDSLGAARPELVALPPASPAYPSGHATGITVFMGLAASFVARETCRARRWRIYLGFSLPMVLVSLSRMGLGVHWLTDIVGGILLGLAICGLVRTSFSRYDRVPLSLDALSLLALALWLGSFAIYTVQRWPTAMAAYST